MIVAGLISGKSGQQLPGSPKTSATANLTYDRTLLPGYDMTLALNGTYHSRVKLNLANSLGTTTVQESSSYAIMNLSATVSHLGWHLTGYVTNVLDKQEILAPPVQPNELGNLTNDYLVNRPRELGLRVGYAF